MLKRKDHPKHTQIVFFTSALLDENMLSLQSLCGYFNIASCFSFSIVTAERDDGTAGCSGQLIGERA